MECFPNPYIGPHPFVREDRIFGRDKEINEVVQELLAEEHVVILAPYGAGKSSLINAGIIPKFKQEYPDIHILPVIRVGLSDAETAENITPFIMSSFSSLEIPLPEQSTNSPEPVQPNLNTALNQLFGNKALLLIFDQFEEIFRYPYNRKKKEEFFWQLGEALNGKPRRALFAMREEWLAQLEDYAGVIEGALEKRVHLGLLDHEAALSAIRDPLPKEVQFDENVAEYLVKELCRLTPHSTKSTQERFHDVIEPMQLQVVCKRIWESLPENTTLITSEIIETALDITNALVQYFTEMIAKIAQTCSPADSGSHEHEIRNWIENELIRQGMRDIRLMELVPQNLVKAIDGLENAHLLRTESRGDRKFIEVAHDRLVDPILKSNER